MQGILKFFNENKHFGFIETEAGDWFFSQEDVIGEIPQRYDPVEFWLDESERDGRLIAVEVQVKREGSSL